MGEEKRLQVGGKVTMEQKEGTHSLESQIDRTSWQPKGSERGCAVRERESIGPWGCSLPDDTMVIRGGRWGQV